MHLLVLLLLRIPINLGRHWQVELTWVCNQSTRHSSVHLQKNVHAKALQLRAPNMLHSDLIHPPKWSCSKSSGRTEDSRNSLEIKASYRKHFMYQCTEFCDAGMGSLLLLFPGSLVLTFVPHSDRFDMLLDCLL